MYDYVVTSEELILDVISNLIFIVIISTPLLIDFTLTTLYVSLLLVVILCIYF